LRELQQLVFQNAAIRHSGIGFCPHGATARFCKPIPSSNDANVVIQPQTGVTHRLVRRVDKNLHNSIFLSLYHKKWDFSSSNYKKYIKTLSKIFSNISFNNKKQFPTKRLKNH